MARALVAAAVRAVPLAVRASVQYLAGRVVVRNQQVLGRRVNVFHGLGLEGTFLRARGVEGHGTMLSKPAVPAAVQHLHVVVPVKVQHPPQARSDERVVVVVGDHRGVVGDPEVAHQGFEGGHLHHEGAVVAALGILILDVEVDGKLHRAWNMSPAVGFDRGAINDADVRVLRMYGQPIRLGKKFGAGIVHGWPSFYGAHWRPVCAAVGYGNVYWGAELAESTRSTPSFAE